MIVLIILLVFSGLLNLAAAYFLFRLSKKLLDFDGIFELLYDEIEINCKFFDNLLQKPLFMASPEIEDANKKMNLMRIRLREFAMQLGENTGRQLTESVKQNPPVVA